MQTQSRVAPHLLLGMLSVLALAAIVVSANTAPPNAREQLRIAAADTAAASSFVLTDTNLITPLPGASTSGAPKSNVITILYQAPDRIEERLTGSNGQVVTLLVIGSSRYERSGNGKWITSTAPSTAGPSAGQQAAQDVLFPLQSVEAATEVVRHGVVFTFLPGQMELVLVRLLGAQPGQLSPGTVSFLAGTTGEFLSFDQVSAVRTGERLTVRLDIAEVGQAPTLAAPAPSQLSTTP
ncbi:MAG TPA: hypothetical protein VMV14_00670 [Acidimicrobiales bacterium]|nr:hypothetical protein [Acidimicrobiales bacterium]